MAFDLFQDIVLFGLLEALLSIIQLLDNLLILKMAQSLTVKSQPFLLVERIRASEMRETLLGHVIEKFSHFG